MASEQVVADLRAIITAHGFKETQAALDGVRTKGAGAASGLKSLFDVMNKANEKAKEAKASFDKLIEGMSKAGKDASPSGRMIAGMSEIGKATKAAADEAERLKRLLEETAKIEKSFDKLIRGMSKAGKEASPSGRMVAGMSASGKAARMAAEEADRLNISLDKGATGGIRRFGISTQKMNQLVQQASFGMQDFLIVIKQGGLGMAMRSASNNAAQMGAIMGGIGGAVAGVGVTLLSLVPDILNMGSAMSKAEKEARSLESRLRKLKDAADGVKRAITRPDFKFAEEQHKRRFAPRDAAKEAADMLAGGTVKSAESKIRDISHGILRGRDKLAGLQDERKRGVLDFQAQFTDKLTAKQKLAIGTQLVTPGFKGTFTAAGAKKLALEAMENELAKVKKGTVSNDLMQAIAGARTKDGKRLFKLGEGEGDLATFGKRMKEADERIKALTLDLAQQTKNLELFRGVLSKLVSKENAKKFDDAWKKFADRNKKDADHAQKEQEKADKKQERISESERRSRLKGLEGEKKALEGILEVTDPIGAKLQKIEEKFREHGGALAAGAVARGEGPFGAMMGILAGAAGGAQAKDNFLKKQQPGISGTFGVADFSRQLQNALLKDDTNKMIQHNTTAIKASTAQTVKKLDDVNRGIANLKSLKGVFGP